MCNINMDGRHRQKNSNFGSLDHALVMLKQLQMCFVQANHELWYRATVNSHNFVHLLRFLCPSDMNPCRFFCSAPNRITSFPRTFLRACTNGQGSNCRATFIVMLTTTTIAKLRMLMAFDSV